MKDMKVFLLTDMYGYAVWYFHIITHKKEGMSSERSDFSSALLRRKCVSVCTV